MVREWNSAEYDRLSDPQYGWGVKVLKKLQTLGLRGDEHILDAGCGTGRVTADLLNAFPRARVTALDASANMIDQARRNLAPFGERVTVQQLDLLDLASVREYDVIFSTAVFHLIKDHDRLFANLFRALRPGGLLLAKCGGGDNLLRLRTRAIRMTQAPEFAPYFKDWERHWEFPTPEVSAGRLRRAGFVDVQTGLEEAPTPLGSEETFRSFVTNVNLQPFLERVPEKLRDRFLDPIVQQAAQDTPPFTLDYWRLNLQGKRPGN